MIQTSASFRSTSPVADGSISLSEIISALSYAFDLTEGAVPGHALRSCLLGMRIASELHLGKDQTSDLYFALLLKDVGCGSNTSRIGRILAEPAPADRISGIIRRGMSRHSKTYKEIAMRYDRGARIVGKLGLSAAASEAVRSLDEHWDGGGQPDALKGDGIPLLSRICAIAQHLDVFSSQQAINIAIDTMIARSGTWFDPDLVRVAASLHRRGTLWTHCRPANSREQTRKAVLDLDAGRHHRLEGDRVDQICEAFAEVVDAKSPFTFRHSLGVADTAGSIARKMGLAQDRVRLVRRAALLHDLGKLSIPNSILNKQSLLTETEWQAVYQHPRLTRQILERVAAFREMAVIAGEHHEKLDGSGYPNHLIAQDLSLESRIVAVADIYGALSEDRPYREGLKTQQITSILAKLAPAKLDGDCVDALLGMISQVPFAEFETVPDETVAQFCA